MFKKMISKFGQIIDQSNWFHFFLLGLSSVALAIIAFLNILFSQDVDLSHLNTELLQPTIIYDRNGNEASKITSNKMEGVPVSDLPKHVKEAVIAIEDRRFYEHGGVDYKGILRAAIKNFTSGEIVQGGSTITQQLAKITMLTPEQTIKRKLKEMILAKRIEHKYTKDEILQMYLNQIYFGHGAWGIQNASRVYFGKDAVDLTVQEGAMLAGLIKAPSLLDPYKNKDKAIKRQQVVLSRMKEYGFISNSEYNNALNKKLTFSKQSDPLKGKFPYYVDEVVLEAIKKYGIEQDELLTGGYKIYTELDQRMQRAVEGVYKRDELFPRGSNPNQLVQSGAVILDPKTGGVRALVGGRGEHVFLGYNRATQAKATPGSTMKPIAVYTPALEDGYKATSFIKDEEMEFGGGYAPKNYNGVYEGEVPMYEALIKSKNIPAVWLLNEIGIQRGLDSSKKFGIPLNKNDRKLGLALGGLEIGTSPLKMAAAYSVFANDGKREDPHVIKKIIDSDGNLIAEHKNKERKVTTKAVVNEITTMLKGVVEEPEGTGTNASIPGKEIAGKTGTTQVEGVAVKNAVKDQWFVGYSPNLVTAVWSGYDQTTPSQYILTDRTRGSNIIFKEIMSESLKYVKDKSFDVRPLQQLRAEADRERFKNYWKEQKEKWQEKVDRWKDKLKKEEKNSKENKDVEKEEKKDHKNETKNDRSKEKPIKEKEQKTNPTPSPPVSEPPIEEPSDPPKKEDEAVKKSEE